MGNSRISRKQFLRMLGGFTIIAGASGVFFKILSPKELPPTSLPIKPTTTTTARETATATTTATTTTIETATATATETTMATATATETAMATATETAIATTTATARATATVTAVETVTITPETTTTHIQKGKTWVSLVEGKSDSDIENMVRNAVKNIGGIESIVSNGQTVVVKPAVLTSDPNCAPDPRVVAAVAKLAIEAGGNVIVAENSASGGATYCLSKIGITAAVEAVGAVVKDLTTDGEIQMTVPDGILLHNVKTYPTILNCDVLISVPRLKRHGGATVTISLKNMMGAIPTSEMSRFHTTGLSQCIADLNSALKPDLAVIDATYAMARTGPTGGRMEEMNTIIASTDPVAADRIAAQCLQELEQELGIPSFNVANVSHINAAAALGVGTNILEEILLIKEHI